MFKIFLSCQTTYSPHACFNQNRKPVERNSSIRISKKHLHSPWLSVRITKLVIMQERQEGSSNSRDWHTPNVAISTSWRWPWRQNKQPPCRNKLYFERYFSRVEVFLELYWLIFFSSHATIYKVLPILIFFSPCCLIRRLTGGHSCSRFSISWGSVICIWWHFPKNRVIDLQPNIFYALHNQNSKD